MNGARAESQRQVLAPKSNRCWPTHDCLPVSVATTPNPYSQLGDASGAGRAWGRGVRRATGAAGLLKSTAQDRADQVEAVDLVLARHADDLDQGFSLGLRH